jgi:hypothetical protein
MILGASTPAHRSMRSDSSRPNQASCAPSDRQGRVRPPPPISSRRGRQPRHVSGLFGLASAAGVVRERLGWADSATYLPALPAPPAAPPPAPPAAPPPVPPFAPAAPAAPVAAPGPAPTLPPSEADPNIPQPVRMRGNTTVAKRRLRTTLLDMELSRMIAIVQKIGGRHRHARKCHGKVTAVRHLQTANIGLIGAYDATLNNWLCWVYASGLGSFRLQLRPDRCRQ